MNKQVKTRKLWPRLVQWLLVLTLPVLLLATDIRIVTGHWFARWEYEKTDFPPDPYGFSTAERIRLAEISMDYLATQADISFLADLRLSNGTLAFNTRELHHMVDVQTAYGYLMQAGIIAALIWIGGIVALLAAGDTHSRAPGTLLNGSRFALGLLAAVGAFMVLSWGEFFTTFHRIFFEGDTWTFPYSDTLIRLFPMRFWIDVAATVVTLLIAEAVVIGAIGWLWRRKLTHND
jgi:integral membrane protein (TIGR01906 family)